VPDEQWAGLQEDHLVLVVHGIGQYYFANTEECFSNCVTALRRNLMEQRCALDVEDATVARDRAVSSATSSTTTPAVEKTVEGVAAPEGVADGNPNNHKRIECLGVEWFNEVHDDPAIGINEGLARVTLPSVMSMRKLAHDVAMDVMLYLTPEFEQKILKIVVEKINLIYMQYCELNPNFVKNGGKCSIVGHSLGTVIVYDILSRQQGPALPAHHKLCFHPTAYFAMGSPLGMFLTIRNSAARLHNSETAKHRRSNDNSDNDDKSDDKSDNSDLSAALNEDVFNASYSFPTCKQFFNIFNKNDPVAYRVEPMADESLQALDPLLVPHHDGGLRAQYLFKSVATSLSQQWQSFSSPSGWFASASSTTSSMLKNSGALLQTSTSATVPPSTRLINTTKQGQGKGGGEAISELHCWQQEAAAKRLEKICPSDALPHVLINNHRRFDFLLQESALEVEYLGSLTSHTSYFEQKDVARFIAAMLI
jgi:hypothetical protein